MEAFIAWIICLGLQFLELCNCFPVTPHSDAGANSPGSELGALAPSLLAALSLLTAVLLLAGCSWCRRIIKKDVIVGQPIPLRNSGTSALVETGIQNPLNDIRYPITAAITSQSPRAQQPDPERSPRHPPHPDQREVEVDNHPFEDNNNGPISEQELENIVNNNAENYIVSEYENRNMNLEANRARAVEVFEVPQTSRNLSSSHASPRREAAAPDVLAEHKDWFDNPNEDFPRNQLQYLQVIGRGWFGRIVEGEAHNLSSIENPSPRHVAANTVTRVAVKILDENVTVMDKCTFLEECRLYRDLRHENLLKFNGRNLTQDPWLVLFEYCPMGDLKQFLLSNKCQMASLNQKGVPLKLQCEIAAALEYLHRHNLLHPDVACHSCLVAEGPTARLGDYGDSERRHPEDYYSLQGDKPLPVRWLPPESKLHHQVTHEGNMWSFGVFLWESCSWGDLPYEQLSDERIVTEVMCADGVRLSHPVPNTEYVTYLYNVMQCCWHADPAQRCASSQVSSYLQNIYSNYHQASSQSKESVTHDFEARWQSLKPNSIPKVDNGLPHTPARDNYYELKFPHGDLNLDSDSSPIPRDHQFVYHNLAISSDTLTGDELSIKAKSDSLTNLHGSFESVLEKNCNVQRDKSAANSANPQSSAFWETSLTENSSPFALSDGNSDKLLFEKEVSRVAPWLRDVPFTTPEDISYIKNVSDVISDFDNMLSSEKTSSSESSHQTSPSREVTSNPKSSSGIAVDVSTSDRTQTSEKLCTENPDISKADSVSDLTKCLSDSPSEGTLNDANIDSDIANSPLHHVPEISNSKESYPTLDFRLANTREETAICDTVRPVETGQEFDSLQDSSYTPDPLKDAIQSKTEGGDDNWGVRRQCSSGSETEDEIWKKRIEMGTITEKIKMKSKSVTDFMVLTHIDMDFTDLESEETSYTSMEGKGNMFFDMIQKKFKPDSPPKESSLPTQEYLSFPRNLSFSLLSRVESLRPDLDLYKLWRSHRCMAVKNLRHTKSLGDLTESRAKNVSVKELQMFKVNLDTFLDTNKSLEKGTVSNDPFVLNVKTTVAAEEPIDFQHAVLPTDRIDPSHNQIQFNLPGNFSFHLPSKETRSFPNISQPPNNSLGFMSDPADHLSVASEEENLKFSSNFNDINLNLYATEHNVQANNEDDTFGGSLKDPWDSTKYISPPDSFHFDVQTDSDTKITNEGPVVMNLFDSQNLDYGLVDKSQIDVSSPVLPNASHVDIESSLSANNFHTDLQIDNVSTSTPVLSNEKTISIENEITLDDVKEIAVDRDNLNTDEITDDADSQVDQKIQEIMHNEMLNLTTKLAIAENENNLNIEYSGPLEVEQVIEEVLEDSEAPVANEQAIARGSMEVNDYQKVENNSAETSSLQTGTESGIESHFETTDKQSVMSHAHGDHLMSQRSELEHACDGSHSTEIESGIVLLDHSEPIMSADQNLSENNVIGINQLKSDRIDINKMFIESEKKIAIPVNKVTKETVSDEPVSLSDNEMIRESVELIKPAHIDEQTAGSRDSVAGEEEQKPVDVDSLENLTLDSELIAIDTKFDEHEKETIFKCKDTEKIVREPNNCTEAESILFHVKADLGTEHIKSDKINVVCKTETFQEPNSGSTDINLQLIESESEIVSEKLPESLNDNAITQKCSTIVDHNLIDQQLNLASASVQSPPLETESANSEQPISRDELIQDLDLELQKLDESHYYSDEINSEPHYVNVGTSTQHREGSSSGWFLHPKPDASEESGKINVAESGGIQHNFEIAQNFAVSNGSSTESLTENSSSERYTVDAESVEALRNELELKLPLAQRLGQIRHDNISDNLCGSKEWPNEIADSEVTSQHSGGSAAEPCRKVSTLNPEPGTSSGTGCSFSEDAAVEDVKSTPQQVRNEVLIHYNMYGVVPLSPIQEESWSEFSEMEKAGDKTDTSNSLSLGEQTSNIENILPFDGVCQAVNTHLVHKHDDKQQNWSDDDTHSDCSNRTFVLNEAGPSNMNRQKSVSADSLDSFDGDNLELDDDNATTFIRKKTLPITSHFPPHSFQASDLLSPFYDDHSHTKSTEEISQNVDNLLENISKTLENASKMTLSSESNELLNQEIPIDEISLNLSDAENSGSKTYVIDDKKSTVKEMSNVYNNKVAELPADDLSNVSKISQPSFISELTSPNDSEIKPSDKSVSVNLHTKTPSMDSWCSNDTLFNVEENFDDIYSNDVLSSPIIRDPLTDSQINTDYSAAAGNAEKKGQDRIPTLYDPFKCGPTLHRRTELPAVEMVMGCTENVHSLSLHGEDVDIFSDFPQNGAKNSPDLPIYFVADKIEPAVESSHLNSMNNRSDDSLTAESGISILAKSEIKQSAPLDDVLIDSPISTIDSGVLKLPTVHNESDEVIDTSNEDTYDVKHEDNIISFFSPSGIVNNATIVLKSDNSAANNTYILKSDSTSYPNDTAVDSIEKTDCHPPDPSPNGAGIGRGVTHDNSAYVNTFEHLQKAMTSTPTSGFDHTSDDVAGESHHESPDNIIDAQFQFLEGIVDSSISYISFKDDGSQNFLTNEKNSAISFPQTSAMSASLPVPDSSIDVGSLQNELFVSVGGSQVTADAECKGIPDSQKICSEVNDISSYHFSVIPSEINLVDSDAATHQYELIQENAEKNSTGLNYIGSPNFSTIANSDPDLVNSDKKHHRGSELEKNSDTDLNVIGSPNLDIIPSSDVILVDSDKTFLKSTELGVIKDTKRNSTGLVDADSPNFSKISSSDFNLADSNKSSIDSEYDVIQKSERNSTEIVDIGSPNFSINSSSNFNPVDSDKTHRTSSQLDIIQDIKINSMGLIDIGSPNSSIITSSSVNQTDSDKTHHAGSELDVILDTKKNSTGLVDIGSPNFSIIPCSDINLVDSDKTHHTCSKRDIIGDVKKNSTGLIDISSPNFSIITSSDSSVMDSDRTQNIRSKCDIIQDITNSCTGLDDVESENFSSIPCNINSIDLSAIAEPSSEIKNSNDDSGGSADISLPIVNMTSLGNNPVDSNTTKQHTFGPELIGDTEKNYKLLEDNSPHCSINSFSVPILVNSSESEPIGDPQKNSTSLDIICSPNNSVAQLPGEDAIVDITKNSSDDFTDTMMHSTGLGDRNSPNFSRIHFPEEKNCIRDWHVNNVTVSFLENERSFSDSLKPKSPAVFLEKTSLSNDVRNNLEIDYSPTLESFLENVAMAPQQISHENVICNSTGLLDISSPELSKIQHDTGNTDVCDVRESPESLQESNSLSNVINYDHTSALEDYVQYTGLNMGSHNLNKLEVAAKESPTFETFKESAGVMPQDLSIEPGHGGEGKRNSADLSDIHFSGPSNDGMMSTSFNELSPSSEEPVEQPEMRSTKLTVDDVNHMAPERLKDWDSESDDSNCSSSSSGDFIWKEGGKEQLLSVSTLLYHSPDFTQKNQAPRGASQSFADIPEEATEAERDGEEDDEDEEVEFVPSSWDCRATPTKSALKSPETSQMDNRKRVVFKKQKYQCIYEYPREVLSNEDDDLQALPDYSTYSDWHPFGGGNGSYMAVDFENFLNSHPTDLHQPSSDLLSEDDFYISSSTRPFETYNMISSSSQFFPGHHLSLFNKPYSGEATEIDDYDSLPTIPTEYDIRQSHLNAGTDPEDASLVNKASFDYITPDSGTEDITPGSLVDYDFKDPFSSNEPFNKNSFSEVTHIDITNPPKDEQEVHLNPSNKNCSFGRPFCGNLILPDRGSSSGSLTPSSPSPSASGHSSQSSGSTSPLPPPPGVLGGLRHTRDKLKLDLPPSPLARNSPSIVTSGKNANKDVKIFDFKNIDALQSDDLDKTLSESTSDVSSSNTMVENHDYKCDRSSKLPEEAASKSSDKVSVDSELCDLTLDGKDPIVLDGLNAIAKMSPFSPISLIGCLIPDKGILSGDVHSSQYEKLSDDAETGQFDSTTLQKAVMPMNDENSSRKASLEPVKGEGTLLDSGDEDSGIGSSAYATLERKMDSKELEPEASKNSNERQVN